MYSVRRPFCLTLRPLFCFQLAGLYRAGLLDEAERSAAGVTAKGIRALRLMADGYSAREEVFAGDRTLLHLKLKPLTSCESIV